MKTIEIDDDLFDRLNKFTTPIFSIGDVIKKFVDRGTTEGLSILPNKEAIPLPTKDSLAEFIASNSFQGFTSGIDKYLAVLSWLFRTHESEFTKAIISYKRGQRVYFAKTEKEIVEGGGGILTAKKIPDSLFWTLATIDNASKRAVLTDLLRVLNFPPQHIQLVRGTIPENTSRKKFLELY